MLHERTTPTGQLIQFEDGLPDDLGKKKRRTYWLGEQAKENIRPSITTVLGVMEKEGIHWAIEKLAYRGAVTLAKDGGLPLDADEALGKAKARGLNFQQQWNAKADKGTATHDWLSKLMADPDTPVPEHCEPFAQGIEQWRFEYGPQAIQSEVMVASPTHGFAGRFDLLATLPTLGAAARIELKTTSELPRHKKTGEVLPPYTENLWQLAAQELAAVESGDPPSEIQAVLRVDEQGEWDFHVTQTEPRGFLAALSLYRALRNIPEPQDQLRLEAA